MTRKRIKNSRVRVDLYMLASVHERLEQYSKEFGRSKTAIIEDAVAIWCNSRDMEAKRGLAQIKQ